MAINFEQIKELLGAITNTDIAEFVLKNSDFELTVRRGNGPIPMVAPSVMAAVPVPDSPKESPIASRQEDYEAVKSPMVGTFYRAPAPDEPPYVEVGDRVRAGQVLCIIEAMKLMNEIEAETPGQVMEILVQNGESVEYGQTLMYIKTS